MVKKKFFKKLNSTKIKDKDNLQYYYSSLSRLFPFSLILIFSFLFLPSTVTYLKENFK